MQSPSRTAREFCADRIRHFDEKANHNKAEALALFILLIACTLAAPLFITLGQGFVLSKIIPSLLSSVATGCAVWLQQRKPQQLWLLYRTMQRQLESEANSLEYLVNSYSETVSPEQLLAERTIAICMNAHQMWAPLVPSPESLTGALGSNFTHTKAPTSRRT